MAKSFGDLFEEPSIAVGAGTQTGVAPPSVVGSTPLTTPAPSEVEITPADVLAQLPFAYISGQAGTGKTFLARKVIEACPLGTAVLTSTTGISAVNLGDATTINSLLGFFDTKSLLEKYASGYLAYRLRMLRKSGIRLIVIDEISMMESDQLDILCQAIDDIDLTKDYDRDLGMVTEEADEDARIRLLLCGDYAQLGPVEGAYAFEGGAWSRFADHTITLTKIHRQGDQGFVRGLNAVRRGDAVAALEILRPCFVDSMDLTFNGTTIVAKNDAVDRLNNLRYMKLKGTEFTFKAIRSGEQQKDWIRLIPEVLKLKPGALVMILANKAYPSDMPDDPHKRLQYANGDLATVIEPTPNGCKVFLHRTMEDTEVTYATREWKEPTGKKKPPYTVKGAVSYMPLRLAYAITTHKSQSLSLDAVQVAITDGFMAKGGMCYVALSRARTLEGLRIVGTERIFLGRCGVEEKVRGWL